MDAKMAPQPGATAAQCLHKGLAARAHLVPAASGLVLCCVGKIVSDAVQRQRVGAASDHALLQPVPVEGAQAVAAERVTTGDLRAITPNLNVLEGLDRRQKAGGANKFFHSSRKSFEKARFRKGMKANES